MSITAGLVPQVQEKNYKKSFHQRHDDSGELEVFEAASYFSGASEISGSNFTQHKILISDGRNSLGIPMISSSSTNISSIPAQTHHHQHHHRVLEKEAKENSIKKYKQPNSPGARLASFLNSLFSSQISSKKKKSSKSSCSTQSIKDEDESPNGRRMRRSINHFPSVNSMNSSADSKSSIYSSSSSGFRTPPPHSNSAPKKNSSYKDLRSYSDHKPVVMSTNLFKNNGHVKFTASTITNGFSSSEKFKNFGNGLLDHNTPLEERDQYIKFINEVDIDDGADRDSSSDLFELPNYDLSGLPVYETTHMDSIK